MEKNKDNKNDKIISTLENMEIEINRLVIDRNRSDKIRGISLGISLYGSASILLNQLFYTNNNLMDTSINLIIFVGGLYLFGKHTKNSDLGEIEFQNIELMKEIIEEENPWVKTYKNNY